MSKPNKVPNDTLIVVCDTRKALFISNSGSPIHPKLGIEKHFEVNETSDVPPRHDRSGRRYDGGGTGGSYRARSSMETNDPNADKAEEFASQIVAELMSFLSDRRFSRFLVAASPAFLGVLRHKYDGHLRNMIAAEIPKNLTDKPVDEIQKSLFEEW